MKKEIVFNKQINIKLFFYFYNLILCLNVKSYFSVQLVQSIHKLIFLIDPKIFQPIERLITPVLKAAQFANQLLKNVRKRPDEQKIKKKLIQILVFRESIDNFIHY